MNKEASPLYMLVALQLKVDTVSGCDKGSFLVQGVEGISGVNWQNDLCFFIVEDSLHGMNSNLIGLLC